MNVSYRTARYRHGLAQTSFSRSDSAPPTDVRRWLRPADSGRISPGYAPGSGYAPLSLMAKGRTKGRAQYPTTPKDQDRDDASIIINELPHIAGSKGWPSGEEFDDYHLAQALHKTKYGSSFTLKGNWEDPPGYLKRWPNGPTGPVDPFKRYPNEQEAWKHRYEMGWSTYVHNILNQYCGLGGNR